MQLPPWYAPNGRTKTLKPLLDCSVEQPVDVARRKATHAEVDMKQRLVRQTRDDERARRSQRRPAPELSRRLSFPDQPFDEAPPLDESTGPRGKHVGRVGHDLADEQPLPHPGSARQ